MKRILKFEALLIILDTCQALSMFNHIITNNVTIFASSNQIEKSNSTKYDDGYSVPLGHLFTFNMCKLLRTMSPNSSIVDLIEVIKKVGVGSTPVIRQFKVMSHARDMKIRDWFYHDK